jgi:hypothetical protein
MIALRKPQASDTMTGGHRWDFMEKLLTSGIDLSSDAKLLLYVLVTHHGDERRVNPGLRRLAEMSSMSNGRCMAARDELIAAGLITCMLGSGTRSSEYHLVALDAWYAEWVAARTSVRNSSASVPDSRSSVHPVETKPSEPSKPEKEGKPDLKVVGLVPATGWRGLVAHAPADYRLHWLDQLPFTEDRQGGITLHAPTSLHADRIRRDLERGGALHDLALAAGIDPEAVTITGPKYGRDPHAGKAAVREGAADGYDPRRSAGRQIREWADKAADRIEARSDGADVVSLAGWRAKRDDVPE